MKTALKYVCCTIGKIAAIVLLPVVASLYYLTIFLVTIYQFFSSVVVLGFVFAAVYTWKKLGFSLDVLLYASGAAFSWALYYLLPYIPGLLSIAMSAMKDFILAPYRIKSPVKYHLYT